MKLLGQLCPNIHSLGSQQEGEAQVKKTHLNQKTKISNTKLFIFPFSFCFFPISLWWHFKRKSELHTEYWMLDRLQGREAQKRSGCTIHLWSFFRLDSCKTQQNCHRTWQRGPVGQPFLYILRSSRPPGVNQDGEPLGYLLLSGYHGWTIDIWQKIINIIISINFFNYLVFMIVWSQTDDWK